MSEGTNEGGLPEDRNSSLGAGALIVRREVETLIVSVICSFQCEKVS